MDRSAKILLLGKTGVGKSAFVNYFLEKEVAKSAAGKSITQEYFIPYEVTDGKFPIKIYDTKGLEALDAYHQLDQIIAGIKQRNNSDNIFSWFHTIFYCVSMFEPRFEAFEATFICRLQQELTQHIHIILTHCDVCKGDEIRHMRQRITRLLGGRHQIEIFEVVCVHRKKRNGTVVQPYGRERIAERVFDLLLQDIAYKISVKYAQTLQLALLDVVNQTFSNVEQLIDTTVNVPSLLKLIRDEEGELEQRFADTLDQMEQDFNRATTETDRKFNRILKPAAQLYTTYQNMVTNSFADKAELAFEDSISWSLGDWDAAFHETELLAKIFPQMTKNGFLDENSDLVQTQDVSFPGIMKLLSSSLTDLFRLKKNLKNSSKRSATPSSNPSRQNPNCSRKRINALSDSSSHLDKKRPCSFGEV